ncbi:MAG: TolC family protein, partial [Muribaculaceae bacterium]|nr:TolC family protein [Muribaculaceae bacterium]
SDAYRQAVRSSLVAGIAGGYYTLLMLAEQVSISERTIKTWAENRRVLQALKRAGRTNEAAVLQARANRMSVENSTLTLRSQISVQENAIRSLLLSPDAELRRGSFGRLSFPMRLSEGISLEVLSNRPDVREAEYRVRQAFYGINVARSAFYPSVTLSGNLGWMTTSGAVANPSSWIANAVGAVVAPLFNRGTNTANLRISKAEYEIAVLQFEQKLLDAGMEVNNALIAWQTATDRIALDKKQVVALRGAVHNTRLLMRNSNTNYLEVLTAQQRLLEAELTEASDRYDAVQAVIKLYRALGGGVD